MLFFFLFVSQSEKIGVQCSLCAAQLHATIMRVPSQVSKLLLRTSNTRFFPSHSFIISSRLRSVFYFVFIEYRVDDNHVFDLLSNTKKSNEFCDLELIFCLDVTWIVDIYSAIFCR